MRGILQRNRESKIYTEGRTYDNKLYIFRETDYRKIWYALDIIVKKLDEKNNWKNLPSVRANQDNDEVFQKEGLGKLLDSNGFEINHSQRLEEMMIAAGTPLNQEQDIMPEYMNMASIEINQTNRIIGIKNTHRKDDKKD